MAEPSQPLPAGLSATAGGETVAKPAQPNPAPAPAPVAAKPAPAPSQSKVPEIGGPSGPEPTRYGDWERNGICVDF
jgi:hypothetical protein